MSISDQIDKGVVSPEEVRSAIATAHERTIAMGFSYPLEAALAAVVLARVKGEHGADPAGMEPTQEM